MTSRQAFFAERIPRYKADPVLYAHEVLNFSPDQWQKDVLDDFVKHDRISVKSGQGVGKTGVEAICALWFLTCHPYARVVATAPTLHQLQDVLWAEIAKWQGRSPLLKQLLKWTKSYVYMLNHEDRWFAVARTATKPENMQGFHEDNMLFIVDEASGIAEPIMEAILGTLTGKNNKLLLCGNPTKTSGTFYDSHTSDRTNWKCHTVNAMLSPRTNKQNIMAIIRKYGAESNVAKVRVFGEFPEQEDDVFIPLSLIEGSIMSEPRTVQRFHDGKEVRVLEAMSIDIGCDIARYGDDKTVIGYKVNEVVFIYDKRQGQNLMKTVNKIIFLAEKLRKEYKWKGKIPIKIDDGGLGGGVTDRLRQIKKEHDGMYRWMDIVPVQFGKPLSKHRFFYDTTTFMMSVVRDLLSNQDERGREKPVELILPNDNDLIAQLSIRKYDMMSNSKIKVESKDEMKKRGLPSPDEADCILLCCLPVGRGKNGKEEMDE